MELDFSSLKQKIASNDKNLTSVLLESIPSLPTAQLIELVSALKSNTIVNSLSFKNTKLSSSDSLIISSLFLQNHSILSLNLSSCGLDDQSCQNFNLILSYSPLETYDISNNNLSVNSFFFLSASLRKNNYSLKNLDLNHSFDLSLGNHPMNVDGVASTNGLHELCRLVKENQTLEKLGLSGLGLGDREIEELVSALRENSSLREINLTDNHIGRAGFLSLRSLFSGTRSLLTKIPIEEGNSLSPLELKELGQLGDKNQKIADNRRRQRTKIENIPAESNKTIDKLKKDLFASKLMLLKETLYYLENQESSQKVAVESLFDNPEKAIHLLLSFQQQNVLHEKELFDLRGELGILERDNHSLSLHIRSLTEKVA